MKTERKSKYRFDASLLILNEGRFLRNETNILRVRINKAI
jgi:hypothetical protein